MNLSHVVYIILYETTDDKGSVEAFESVHGRTVFCLLFSYNLYHKNVFKTSKLQLVPQTPKQYILAIKK